jgi:hypothetical protein
MRRSIPSSPLATPASARSCRKRGLGFVWLAFLLPFVFLGGSAVSVAQEDNNATYWLRERAREGADRPATSELPQPHVVQRPTHLLRRAAPVRGFAREVPAGVPAPPAGEPVTPVPGADTAAAPAAPTSPTAKPAAGSFVVAVMGDSLGTMLAAGLSDAFADKPEFVVRHDTHDDSGLVRDDYFDWMKEARSLLAGPDKIDAAVIMVGSNDRQQIRDGTSAVQLHTPRWKQLYAARVEALADLFRDKKIPLIWVGLPIMQSQRLSADMLDFNQIYREATGKAGATYIDIWEAFADDRGQFSAYGPDVTGQFMKIRTSDGIHFTKAGSRTLAHFVEDDLRRDQEQARPPVDPAVAALEPSTPAPAAAPANARPAANGAGLAVPVPAPPPAVVIPVKPAAGPVVPLNAPAVSPDGQLAAFTPANTNGKETQTLVDRALVEGHPLESRPGRADDFSWPKQ